MVGLAVGLVWAVSACSESAITPPPRIIPSPSGCVITDGTPEFFGPWRDEYEHAYYVTTNDYAKQILCSGAITPEDIAVLDAAFITCLDEVGLPGAVLGGYGTLEITTDSSISSKTVDVKKTLCESETGWDPVVSLYFNVLQNPNKGDLSPLVADCFVRNGLEPPGFSGADFDAEFYDGGGVFANISDRELLWSCYYDPLGTGLRRLITLNNRQGWFETEARIERLFNRCHRLDVGCADRLGSCGGRTVDVGFSSSIDWTD
ncbi:MAG: hypothetical protein FWD55_07740, partial [Propionibacteriaceae bacterium]|nr:hypothetical protein [Propionibacteriaceae bacterium]